MTNQMHEETAERGTLRRRLGRSLGRYRTLALARIPRPCLKRAPKDAGGAGSFAALMTDALAATGAWAYETDAARILRRLSPIATPAGAALIGRDMRSLFDPLSPISEHARMARAIEARQPFTDLLMPISHGTGPRLLRVSGAPFFDAAGGFSGYRGLAIDAATTGYRPDAAVELIAPDVRHALVNTLGLIVGFGHILQDDLPGSGAQEYIARILIAAATARNIVAASGRNRERAGDADTGGPQPVRVVTAQAAPLRRRVLLVHEIAEIADLLSIAFDRAGFESAVCRDGAEAIEILEEDPALWDVLISDAANAASGRAGLLYRAKQLRPDLLCVVCAEPEQAALVEADADLCWPRPTDALALVKMIDVQLRG
jgi:CheY-like chemotaxis protein